MPRNNYAMGLLLIGIAIFLLLGKLGVFAALAKLLWPLGVLIVGLIFHVLYFWNVLPAGVLVPGGMLTTYSILFLFCNLFGWKLMAYLWPGFILGVAIGLYELYRFGDIRDRGVLLAAIVLAVVAGVFFLFKLLVTAFVYLVAFSLLLIGVYLLVNRKSRSW